MIKHRSGKQNANADALSRAPLSGVSDATEPPTRVIAHLLSEKDNLATLQRQDEELKTITEYLETGVLPEEDRIARQLVLTKSQFLVKDSVLYQIASDFTCVWFHHMICGSDSSRRFIVGGSEHTSAMLRYTVHFTSIMGGMVCVLISPGATRACPVCATHNAVRPPLCPIPVAGPFGVDVIQFPQSNSGNQYAVIFEDYLTKWPKYSDVCDQTTATVA